MSATPNGCTCEDVLRIAARDGGEPMPPGWKCISCRGREEAAAKGYTCSRCRTGLIEGGNLCTECQWAIEDGDA